MGTINERGNRLFLDFRYRGVRCREYTKLDDFRGKMNQKAWPDGAAFDRVQFMKRTVNADQY